MISMSEMWREIPHGVAIAATQETVLIDKLNTFANNQRSSSSKVANDLFCVMETIIFSIVKVFNCSTTMDCLNHYVFTVLTV